MIGLDRILVRLKGGASGRDAIRYHGRIWFEVGTCRLDCGRDLLEITGSGPGGAMVGPGLALLRLDGGTLALAFVDPADPDRPFADLAKTLAIEGYGDGRGSGLERFGLPDGTEINLKVTVSYLVTSGLGEAGPPVSLSAALGAMAPCSAVVWRFGIWMAVRQRSRRRPSRAPS